MNIDYVINLCNYHRDVVNILRDMGKMSLIY